MISIKDSVMTDGMSSEKENEYQIKDFMLVQRIVRRINSILDLSELLVRIIEDASETLGFSKCGILLYDREEDQLELVAVTGWEGKEHKVGDRFIRGEGIVWRAFDRNKVIYYPDINLFPGELLCDFTSQSHVDIPLISRGNTIGILNAQHKDLNGFSRHKIRVLKTLASHISVAIENAKLFELEKKEKETMLRDLQEASRIQKSLIPEKPPSSEKFYLEGICEPCFEVGGDWYDFISLSAEKTGVVLADVSGKGLAASLLMASARMIMRMIAVNEKFPSDVLIKVNDILIADLPSSRFITMIFAVIDHSTGKIEIVSAGHNQPVIVSSGQPRLLQLETGLPLGIRSYKYTVNSVILNPGESLFLYSDGLTEATNSRMEFFGEDGLLACLKEKKASVNTLYQEVKSFSGREYLNDDFTAVRIKSLKNNSPVESSE